MEFDRDTFGLNGSPDITQTIFDKIDKSVLFVCDISIVSSQGAKKTPNPNVLIELGYAVSKLGWEHIICLFDSNTGSIEDLPFDLRQKIAVVSQDVFLFAGTVRDNILYGAPDKTEEEMIVAAKRANIHDYVMTLPNGYDTQVGERGVKLSGGQKQRISIARAFLKNPPILILDEATSALDNMTEMQVQKSLAELSTGRTTLVVAHRLSTVKNADEILVLTEGQITERGSHEELISQGGVYADLYRYQFKE